MLNNYSFKVFSGFILLLYLILLSWVLFFQIGETDRETYFENPDDHLLPFHSTFNMIRDVFNYRFTSHGSEYRNILLLNILGNLVLLLPWGFLAPLVFNKLNTVKKVAASGFLISFLAEIIQFSFSLGVFDVDDLILNTIGALVGFYLLVFAKTLFLKWKATRNKSYEVEY